MRAAFAIPRGCCTSALLQWLKRSTKGLWPPTG